MKNENNNLIYGKGQIQGIISMEDKGNGFIEVFTQNSSGKVSSQDIPYEYWLLTHKNADQFSKRLTGNGHYLYKNPFSLREDFEYAKRCLRKEQAMGNAFWVNDIKEQFMLSGGETYYKGLKHSEVSILSFDIETTGLEHNDESKVLLISNTFRDTKGKITRKLFSYDEYESDKEMFEAWCAWVNVCDPSILCGHNIFSFDLPYLDYCADRCSTSLALGKGLRDLRFNGWTSKKRKDATQFYEYTKCFAYGREIVDTFFLALTYDVGRKYESYGLKSIIEHEGLEVKDRVFYDASLIRKNYRIPSEWKKIKAYAMHDADDALALWDLMGPPYFYLAQNIPKSMQEMLTSASGSQINSLMCRNYMQEGYSLPKASAAAEYEGAISLGNPGIYRNVMKVDVSSLYPSIMIEYGVYNKEKDPKGYFKEIVKEFTEQRLTNKKLAKTSKYHDDLQAGQKIFINSCYGFLGATGLNFNSPSDAAFITRKGREILQKSIKWATE